MKNNAIDLIEAIIKDYLYFKKKKNFINLIESINYELFKEEKIVLSLIGKIKEKIANMDDDKDEKTLTKVKNKLEYFVVTNEKDYLDIIRTDDYTIKEYEKYYLMYINNKNINLIKTIENVFLDKEIISVTIDNVLRKNIEKITKDDVMMSKSIKVKVSK